MPQITNIRSRARSLTKTQKLSAACCAGLGVATLAITATPSEAQTHSRGCGRRLGSGEHR